MNVLLTNILQMFHEHFLQDLYPSLNYLQHRKSLIPPSAKTLEMKNICVQRVLNTVKNSELSHIYKCFDYW